MQHDPSSTYVAVIFWHSCIPFSPGEWSWYIFSTRNNYCQFLASYGVIIQTFIQSFLKTPLCGASLSYFIMIFNCISHAGTLSDKQVQVIFRFQYTNIKILMTATKNHEWKPCIYFLCLLIANNTFAYYICFNGNTCKKISRQTWR